jgi:hypothetical protein
MISMPLLTDSRSPASSAEFSGIRRLGNLCTDDGAEQKKTGKFGKPCSLLLVSCDRERPDPRSELDGNEICRQKKSLTSDLSRSGKHGQLHFRGIDQSKVRSSSSPLVRLILSNASTVAQPAMLPGGSVREFSLNNRRQQAAKGLLREYGWITRRCETQCALSQK